MHRVQQFVPFLILIHISFILAKPYSSSKADEQSTETSATLFEIISQDVNNPLLHEENNRRVKRIVGGYEAPESFYTSIVGVRYRDNSTKRMYHQCGGTLISPMLVLTAAHCLEPNTDPTHYDIMAGDWDNTETEGTEQQIKITKFHIHPKFQGDQDLPTDDMLILELETPVTLTDFVTIANLPKSDFSYFNGRMCTILGWGATKPDRSYNSNPTRLRAAQLPIYNQPRCLEIADIEDKQLFESLESSICAGYPQGGIDPCAGDSGGGLMCQENDGITYLTGVHSWGSCGAENSPGVYTKVADYADWIEQIVSGMKT